MEMSHGMPREASTTPRSRLAWVLLDWGASSYSTIQITLMVAYVERVVFANEPWGIAGGVVWAWTLGIAMLTSALVTPLAAGWADRYARHRTALAASVFTGSLACLGLGLAPPSSPVLTVMMVGLSAVGFDLAAVFTGALLPAIADGPDADRLSARGFAAGYAGGAIALLAAAALVGGSDAFGLDKTTALRLSFGAIGIWWLLFSLPAVSGAIPPLPPAAGGTGGSVRELARFAGSLAGAGSGSRQLWLLGKFLLGAVLVMGAVQTMIGQVSSVAIGEFNLDAADLVNLVLLVQGVALPGAIAIGWLSVHRSRRLALAVCLAGWSLVLGLAWFVAARWQLVALAVLLALVLGGVQSVLRAVVAVLAPKTHAGSAFGLFQVGSKLTGFVASMGFGLVYEFSGRPRAGIIVLLLQLLAGWLLLARVPMDEQSDDSADQTSSPSTSRIE
jgi:UMF1 family MFS transporter